VETVIPTSNAETAEIAAIAEKILFLFVLSALS